MTTTRSEAVSNPWIRLGGKGQVDEKAEHTRQVVSIFWSYAIF